MGDLTESELVNLRDNLVSAQARTKKELNARRMRVIGKVLLYTAVIAGGAVTVVFPNPITAAALVGVVALIDWKGADHAQLEEVEAKEAGTKGGEA